MNSTYSRRPECSILMPSGLEQKTGTTVPYRLMAPFTTPFYDHLSIQKAAKQIADFIGLIGFTFIVAVAKQKEKVSSCSGTMNTLFNQLLRLLP